MNPQVSKLTSYTTIATISLITGTLIGAYLRPMPIVDQTTPSPTLRQAKKIDPNISPEEAFQFTKTTLENLYPAKNLKSLKTSVTPVIYEAATEMALEGYHRNITPTALITNLKENTFKYTKDGIYLEVTGKNILFSNGETDEHESQWRILLKQAEIPVLYPDPKNPLNLYITQLAEQKPNTVNNNTF